MASSTKDSSSQSSEMAGKDFQTGEDRRRRNSQRVTRTYREQQLEAKLRLGGVEQIETAPPATHGAERIARL